MNIIFNKLKVANRFNIPFEDWRTNNELHFSNAGFINIYAANGVGKSSLARALKNELGAEYKYSYNGKEYTNTDTENPILVIDDFFFRNIAVRDNEKISDYILGYQINKEIELKNQIDEKVFYIREELINILKSEYGIKTKDSNFVKCIENKKLINFINSLANNRDKGGKYDANAILDLLNSFKLSSSQKQDTLKYNYVKKYLNEKDSIIKEILDFNTDGIKPINEFNKLEIKTDAIEILKKHGNIKVCIFEETHKLPDGIKEQLEENKKAIINELNKEEKSLVEKIFKMQDEPLAIKEKFIQAFEIGNSKIINNLILEVQEIVLQIENEIAKKICDMVQESKINQLNEEYIKLIDGKVELSKEEEIFLKNVIENCINKKISIKRDENKNIIFTIEGSQVVGKQRKDLPLSTGEQNFISLYFELLSAKNSAKDVIVIDDPISSFDSIYKNKIIYSIIKVLQDKNVIILTHNIDTIRLMQHQYKGCFNLYLFNNEKNGTNGLIRVDGKSSSEEMPKDMDLILEIKNVIDLLKMKDFKEKIVNKKQFLVSIIPFMRSYTNLFSDREEDYKKLCKLLHGYETEKIDVNDEYNKLFNIDVLNEKYEINIDDILSLEDVEQIISIEEYPLLNRTLVHQLNYIKLRLIVEKTLYETDKSRLNVTNNPSLHEIIEKYLNNDLEVKAQLLSKKTLLNEFNHFEFDMCLFMPSLDISDTKLEEERESIIEICKNIRRGNLK